MEYLIELQICVINWYLYKVLSTMKSPLVTIERKLMMSARFDSIREGLEEAIAWKKGKKTGASVRTYSAMDVAKIRKKTKLTQKERLNRC